MSEPKDKTGGIFKRLFGKKEKRKISEPFNCQQCQFPLPPPPPACSLPSPPIPPHKSDSSPGRSNDSIRIVPPPPPAKPLPRTFSLPSLVPIEVDLIPKNQADEVVLTFPCPPSDETFNFESSIHFWKKKEANGPKSLSPGPISSSRPNSNDSGVSSLNQDQEREKISPLPRPALLPKPPSLISPKPTFTSIDRPGGLQYQSTLLPNAPSPSTSKTLVPPSPLPPKPAKKPEFKVEDGLEDFYPGDITFIKRLQKGGQGSVDLVSTKFYRRVAVKRFDQRVGQWEAAVTRELSTLLKAISHPNIVHSRGVLFASPNERDVPMGILMEFMDGGSVWDAIYNPSAEYSITTALNWCRQAASALSFLHRRNLIHRDVKPGNMLLCDGQKKLKISDFRFCTRAISEMTADVGTVIYMPLEIITIHAKRTSYDEKCDVYSLGISLWEMIHRRPPHGGVALLTLMNAVRIGSRPQIDTDLCSSQMFKLIEGMWTEKPKDRLDMEEVHGELEKILDSLGFFDNYE